MPDLLFLKKDVFVDVCHQTLTGNIGSGGLLLVGEVLFHLGDIADAFLGKPLKLSIINVGSVHGQNRLLGQVHLFEQIMVVLGRGGQFYHHRHAHLVLHYGVYLHSAFLFAVFGMPTHALEEVVKQDDGGRIHHVELLFPRLFMPR